MELSEVAFRAWVDPRNQLSQEHLIEAWAKCDAYTKASWENVARAVGEGVMKIYWAGKL